MKRIPLRFRSLLRRIARREEGNVTIEFIIWFPFFMLILATTLELGVMSFRQIMLERAVDVVVRDVRIRKETPPQHDVIRDRICAKAPILHNCKERLRLEMVEDSLRNWKGINPVADCVDRSAEVRPVRNFSHGGDHQLLLLRACVKVEPLFPHSRLMSRLPTDSSGDMAHIAIETLVQEPGDNS